MKLHERFLVCIQEKLDKATHIFRERVLVLQITMRGLQTPGITKTYRFFLQVRPENDKVPDPKEILTFKTFFDGIYYVI